jgi:hypothetical protein
MLFHVARDRASVERSYPPPEFSSGQNSTGRGVNKTQYPPRRRQPPQPSLPLRGVDYCRRQHVSVFCLATHRSSRPLQRPGHPARRPPLRGRARKEGEACSHRSMTGIARGALHLSRPAPPDPSRKGGSWRESAATAVWDFGSQGTLAGIPVSKRPCEHSDTTPGRSPVPGRSAARSPKAPRRGPLAGSAAAPCGVR